MDEVEKQIQRAFSSTSWHPEAHGKAEFFRACRDLLAGKFKEEPLPEIAKPPFLATELFAYHSENRGCWYVSASGQDFECTGPDRSTQRDAILAWNAVFAKRDER